MTWLRLLLRLEEPVLVGAAGGDANTAPTEGYLPASAIRGALIDRSRSDPDLHTTLLGESIRFLHAYPAVQGTHGAYRRSLPVPLTWRRSKGAGAHDRLVLADADSATPPGSVVSGYFVREDEGAAAERVETATLTAVHHRRHRGLGRAVKASQARDGLDPGSIFRFVSLPPGRRFIAAIAGEDRVTIAAVRELLAQAPLRLGKSRTSYGRVEIESLETAGAWSEVGEIGLSEPRAVPAGQPFQLTLLSPGIFRDDWGGSALEPDLRAIEQRLQIPALSLTCLDRVVVVGSTGGFNRKWNLPVATTPVAAAGSVYTLVSTAPIPALQGLLDSGVGERQTEGFGRVAIDLPVPVRWKVPRRLLEPIAAVELEPEHEGLAAMLASRLFAGRIEDYMARESIAWKFDPTPTPKTSRATLSRLRDAAVTAAATGRPEHLAQVLGALKGQTAAAVAQTRVWRPDKPDMAPVSLGAWVSTVVTRDADILKNMRAASRVGGVDPAQSSSEVALRCAARVLGQLRRQLQHDTRVARREAP